ncbi:variant erythrocyte surface antigen-1 family protein [Babesia caballi]|uniref:Variant erythrocyte surface antigen-1 family protein n=1 Tax=Babesia caballi TaxID=5871 RepID=A0AAV4LKY8_BABCB|nr:variant erythrocyte surface antigen-1 family protein [Babesia caballi]
MMTGGKKSLTEPPQNLKEAIDWVLKLKTENNAIDQLAEALDTLLKNVVGDVAVRVKGVYEGICEKFCNDCEKEFTPALILKYYIKNLEKLGPAQLSEDKDDETFLKKFKDGSSNLKTCITKLPENLKTFLGCDNNQLTSFNGNGIIKSNGSSSYTPAYQNATWNAHEATECAVILLTVAQMLFIGLGYFYWQCESKDGNWKDQQFQYSGSSTNALSAYLDAMGFKYAELSEQKKQGSQIAEVLEQTFSELTKNASLLYHKYLGEMIKKAVSPSTSPLACCFAIATPFFTPNDTYTVETSSPATPSFAGYSGTAALASGAYGFNLGGLGTFVSGLLV